MAAAKTKYVILRGNSADGWTQLVGEWEGHSSEEAIRTAHETKGGSVEDGWLAIPVSQFRVAKIAEKVTTTTEVTFDKPARVRTPREEAAAS